METTTPAGQVGTDLTASLLPPSWRAEPELPADEPAQREHPVPFLAAWALIWALVGAIVGGAVAFTTGRLDLAPVLVASVLFAEVVGFTALISARVIFPFFSRLPLALRLLLQVMTLFSATLLGSVMVLAAQPLFSLARFRTVIMIVLVNASLAVIVGILLHTFDSMRRQIEASYRTLREKERLERELAIAREVQRELLPRSTPELAGLELAGVCISAIDVGGDYYDYLQLTDDTLGLVIADVSGKGVPAALLMAGLQASVRSLALAKVPPPEINRRLNEILHASTAASRYATFFYGQYDLESRRLTYSNAGHYPPLLVRPSGSTRLCHGGLPIGILQGSQYGEGVLQLGAGDLLALYTDGIVEAPNRDDDEFGEQRLAELLARNGDRPLEEIIRTVLDEVARWSEGQPRHDDVTLVLARAR